MGIQQKVFEILELKKNLIEVVKNIKKKGQNFHFYYCKMKKHTEHLITCVFNQKLYENLQFKKKLKKVATNQKLFPTIIFKK